MAIESEVSVLLLFMLIVLVILQGRNHFVRFLPQLITKRRQRKARVLILYTSMLENRHACSLAQTAKPKFC